MSASADAPAAGPEKYDNAADAEALFEQRQETKRERRQEWTEATAQQRRIEEALRSETVMLPLGDAEMEFRVWEDRDTSEWAAVVGERVRRIDGDDYREELSAELDRIYSELGEHAEPDWADRCWFEANVRFKLALQLVVSLNAEQDVRLEDTDQFRGE